VGDGLPASVTNLTIANTGVTSPSVDNIVTGNAGQIVTGTLTVASGNYVSHSQYNDVVINSGGTLTLTGDTTVGGNWTNNGGTLAGNFRVTFDGGDQTITGNTTFYQLTKATTATSQTLTFKPGGLQCAIELPSKGVAQ